MGPDWAGGYPGFRQFRDAPFAWSIIGSLVAEATGLQDPLPSKALHDYAATEGGLELATPIVASLGVGFGIKLSR